MLYNAIKLYNRGAAMEELVYTTLNECERTATALEELIFPTIDSL